MIKKKLLAINLNEFSLKYLKYGAKKYNCKNIIKFLNLKHIKTYSLDKVQDKDLDPWVQNISMNTGKRSKDHKIYNLGEPMPKKFGQIWDYLSNIKCNSAIWGPMNTNFINKRFIKLFMPDPWNNQSIVKPDKLNDFYKLARIYAQNYTEKKNKISFIHFLNTMLYIFKNGIILELLKNFNLFFLFFLKKGFKSYFIFFLFDIVSLYIFKNQTKYQKINFSLIFLNSLAHFQHNNWDNKKEEKDYFLFTDIILKIIFEIFKQYDSLIIYNGFSQKKIKSEFILRPINPKKFIKSHGVKFNKFHSDMTNGAILNFKDEKTLQHQLKKIKKINILGYQLYETKILQNNNLFCKIKIRSKKNNFYHFTKKNIKKILFFEKKKKLLKHNVNYDLFSFFNNIRFIKTTGKHIPNGELFYKNINLNKKKIENIEIFNLIQNFFS